jgi:hypothetical protein
MGDAMDGLVIAVGGQIVEQEHRRIALAEEVFQSQDLPPVTKRALRQQPDLRKTV